MNFKIANSGCAAALTMIFLCLNDGYAQVQNNQNSNSYSTAQLKYMMRTGFDPNGYDWSNEYINSILNEAMLDRRSSTRLMTLGIGFYGVAAGFGLVRGGSFGSSELASLNNQIQMVGALLVGTVVMVGIASMASKKRYRSKYKIKQASLALR